MHTFQRGCRHAERKWHKSRCLNDKTAYKSLQELYFISLKSKRKIHNSNSLYNVKNYKRKLFRKLNQLLGKEQQILPHLTDNKTLAQEFAHFFNPRL